MSLTKRIEVPEVFEPLFAPARYKGAWGGRGSGKSHTFALMAVIKAATEGLRIVCVREIQNSIKDSVKQLIEDKINALGLAHLFAITEHEIRATTGGLIIFRGLQNHTAASIKSLEGFHIAWIEEAQTISQRSLDLLIPTIRAPGSEIWASWNPAKEDDPVDVLLRVEPPDGAVVIKANWSDNPWFPQELRDDLERDRQRDPDKFQHIWEGGYERRSETRIFRNWRVDRLKPPHGVVWHYGIDFGFANDPTAAVRCAIWGQTLYVDAECAEVGVPIEATPALLDQVPGIRDWPSRADCSRPETIDYLKRHGFVRIRGAAKGKNSVKDGIEFLRGFDIVVSPECPQLERELTLYSYKTDRITGGILPEIEDANNHLVDALRYAVEGLHRRGTAITAPPAKRPRRSDYGIDDDEQEATGSWKTQ